MVGIHSSGAFMPTTKLPVNVASSATDSTRPNSEDNQRATERSLDSVHISAEGSQAASVTGAEPIENTGPNRNPYANTIFTFIEAQLRRDVADGADTEALQTRLEAGLEGFLQGYSEALAQLEGMGQLNGAVSAAVNETKVQVLEGIQALADELGLAVPDSLSQALSEATQTVSKPVLADAHPSDDPLVGDKNPLTQLLSPSLSVADQNRVKLIESMQATLENSVNTYAHLTPKKSSFGGRYSESSARAQTFDLQVKTQDGDLVTLKVYAKAASIEKGSNQGAARASHQSSSTEFVVEGELDAGELKAINELLADTQAIAAKFFNGELDQAFEQAMDLALDTTELSAFVFELKQVDTQKVVLAPESLIPAAQDGPKLGLNDYAKEWLEQAVKAEDLGVPSRFLLDFIRVVERQEQTVGLSSFVRATYQTAGMLS